MPYAESIHSGGVTIDRTAESASNFLIHEASLPCLDAHRPSDEGRVGIRFGKFPSCRTRCREKPTKKRTTYEHEPEVVQLVDDHGHALGNVTWSQAQALAHELRANLVELDADTIPPTFIATRLGERMKRPGREKPGLQPRRRKARPPRSK